MSTHKQNEAEIQKGADNYPGVAVDIADKKKTCKRLVKERTRTLNNNPRNNDIDN